MAQPAKRTAADRDPRRETMRYWLGRVLREHRQEHGLSLRRVAALIPGKKVDEPLDPSSLGRFESGSVWPGRPDETVIAYAAACGIEDPRSLWVEAANRLQQEGSVSREGLTPAELGLRLALEARQRTRPDAGESQ